MSRRAALLRAFLAALAAVLVAGCGVAPDDRPEEVSTDPAPASAPGIGSSGSGPLVTLYLIRGADLTPVVRRTTTRTTPVVLDLLLEGPTRIEAADGIRTALAPELVGVEATEPDGTVTLTLTRGFTGLTGGNQLLAVAQVVWSLTELPAVTGVRFTVEGAPVEVPTDEGLTASPVERDDYASVAPATPTPSPSPTTGPPDDPEDPEDPDGAPSTPPTSTGAPAS
ncbi:GerMN domain-containing protein [Blastococcus goldschmidtiae]|uniref:GerMN domain-containing protein n=1 Tax=Blastococcus goldschmidtiae TaxID=3075546 RepID=A0ABU2K5M0_9ACTN|nr:GerMN domain-containing protein [Blastococcus sp. DSM 46792]MDT0275463.1 GerMN domain-containing protein [Blastococcus sp. DSM 46792]